MTSGHERPESNEYMHDYENVAVIVLAAGRGQRMGELTNTINKTAYKIGDRPIIARALEVIDQVGVGQKLVVVGYQSGSVQAALSAFGDIEYVEQAERLGTGHAVKCALEHVDNRIEYVIVVNGDDSFKYNPGLYKKLVAEARNGNDLVLVTTVLNDPKGLGRVKRDDDGRFIGVVEDKDATADEAAICEISTGTFCFTTSFVRTSIESLKPHVFYRNGEEKQEYFLPDLIEIAVGQGRPVMTVGISADQWLGINSPDDIALAEHV